MANGDIGVVGRQSRVTGGGLWPPFHNIAPPALPYMLQSKCFDYCVPTPEFTLHHFPPPCIGTFTCTNSGNPPPNP